MNKEYYINIAIDIYIKLPLSFVRMQSAQIFTMVQSIPVRAQKSQPKSVVEIKSLISASLLHSNSVSLIINLYIVYTYNIL